MLIGEILGGFVIVFLVGKLIQKLLSKFTKLEQSKALAISTVTAVAFCSLAAFTNMGASSFIIYPVAGVGAWFYGLKRLSASAIQI